MPRTNEPAPFKAGPGSVFREAPIGLQGKKTRRLTKKAKRVAGTTRKEQEDGDQKSSPLSWTETSEDLLSIWMPSVSTTATTTTTATTAANVVSTVKKKKIQKQNQKKRVNVFDSDSSSSGSYQDGDIKPTNTTDSPTKLDEDNATRTRTKKPFPSTIPSTRLNKTAASVSKRNALQAQKQLQKEPSYSDLLSSPSVKERMRSLPSAKKEISEAKSKGLIPPVLTPTKMKAPSAQQQQKSTVKIRKGKPKLPTQTSVKTKRATGTLKAKNVSTASASAIKINHSKNSTNNANFSAVTHQQAHLAPTEPNTNILNNRCAIAFDTRFLDTPLGQNFGTDWIDDIESFLASLASRGARPHILTCSAKKEKATTHSSRKRYSLTAKVVASGQEQNSTEDDSDDDSDPGKESQDTHCVTPAWIPPPPNMNNRDRKAVKVPKHLLANESWAHFGELGTFPLFYYLISRPFAPFFNF